MRVFNTNKTEELKEYDLSLGYLEKNTLTTHIEAVEGIEEQGHYEIIAEYPNGGKDVEWIIDVPKVESIEEHDEIEDIYIYTPYTETELIKMHLNEEKRELEAWLLAHDYIGTKIATGRATVEDYTDIIEEMNIKAKRINEIDELLIN